MQAAERELVLRLLKDSRERVREVTRGLSREQLDYRPAADCWSVACCVEHITIVEGNIRAAIERMLQAPGQPDQKPAVPDRVILEAVPVRQTRVKGPERAMPTGRWPEPAELFAQFEATREQTLHLAATAGAGLKERLFPHPIFGPLNCYQWLLFTGTHCERHVKQMEEVMADAAFPPRGASAHD